MASTVTQILAKFNRKYPECDSATALQFFQDSHRTILTRVQVRNVVQYVDLVSGQRETLIDPSIFKVHSAYYENGQNSSFELDETSTDELTVINFGWRMNTSLGEPTRYYIIASAVAAGGGDTNIASAQNAIGFDIIPATSTSGTYPRVALYCTAYQDLSGSMTVPSNLLTDNVYLYTMFNYWAEWIEDAQTAEYWRVKSEEQINLNHEHVTNMQSQGQSGYIYTAAFMPTRVR